MSFGIMVRGGTNAGWRTIAPAGVPWTCPSCKTLHAKHWTKCKTCATPRP